MTKSAIVRHLPTEESLAPGQIFELGPGAGTWTKVMVGRYSNAELTLLDISREMLGIARKAVPDSRKVEFIEGDILSYEPHHTYDLFFSSRVLEYIPDKRAFTKKVAQILRKGGEGLVVTKMPHYVRERIRGRVVPEVHRGQIHPSELAEHFRGAGFEVKGIYPVTLSFPILHFASLNRAMEKLFGGTKLNPISQFFTESYAITFRKL